MGQVLDPRVAQRVAERVEKRFADESDVHVTTKIPTTKKRNALKSCGVPADEQILVLIDATVFGSAENALLIGSRGLYLHNDWAGLSPGRSAVPWSELLAVELTCPGTHEARVGLKAHFNTSGCSLDPPQIQQLLEDLRIWIQDEAPEPSSAPELLHGPPGPHILEAVRARLGSQDDLFCSGQIPESKLSNARKTCEVPADEEILVLIDATVFGSAKNALLIGTQGLYLHNDWASTSPGPSRVPWAALRQLEPATAGSSEAQVGPEAYFDTSGCAMSVDQVLQLVELIQSVLRRVDTGS